LIPPVTLRSSGATGRRTVTGLPRAGTATAEGAKEPDDAGAGPSSSAGPSLSASLTSFVGRETELAEIAELARASRMLTITGAALGQAAPRHRGRRPPVVGGGRARPLRRPGGPDGRRPGAARGGRPAGRRRAGWRAAGQDRGPRDRRTAAPAPAGQLRARGRRRRKPGRGRPRRVPPPAGGGHL